MLGLTAGAVVKCDQWGKQASGLIVMALFGSVTQRWQQKVHAQIAMMTCCASPFDSHLFVLYRYQGRTSKCYKAAASTGCCDKWGAGGQGSAAAPTPAGTVS
jgi:hypothetical protein